MQKFCRVPPSTHPHINHLVMDQLRISTVLANDGRVSSRYCSSPDISRATEFAHTGMLASQKASNRDVASVNRLVQQKSSLPSVGSLLAATIALVRS
jgi:hypothetical protein